VGSEISWAECIAAIALRRKGKTKEAVMTDAPAKKTVTAAMLVIGDEILSGRTQDANVAHFATVLGELGIQLKEVRVIPDEEDVIVDAVNIVRLKFDYVFTTGGIGPTHDDITADSMAKAFGVGIEHDPRAVAIMEARHGKEHLNEARLRMARIPIGADLVENPISAAPGFVFENVYVMAGIPMIAESMLETIKHQLVGGKPVLSKSIAAQLAEGQVAAGLTAIQGRFPDVSIGSYPYYIKGQFGVSLVLRSQEVDLLDKAYDEVEALVRECGVEPIDRPV
jgi:molybdenum cofactor synthesis domain-containing protein